MTSPAVEDPAENIIRAPAAAGLGDGDGEDRLPVDPRPAADRALRAADVAALIAKELG